MLPANCHDLSTIFVFFALQCPWWTWECFRAFHRIRDVLLRQGVFLVAALLSGVLYFFVISALLRTQHSARKVALVRAFVALYLLWLMCFIPYDGLELYYLNNDSLQLHQADDFAPAAFKDHIEPNNRLPGMAIVNIYDKQSKRFLIAEAFLGN